MSYPPSTASASTVHPYGCCPIDRVASRLKARHCQSVHGLDAISQPRDSCASQTKACDSRADQHRKAPGICCLFLPATAASCHHDPAPSLSVGFPRPHLDRLDGRSWAIQPSTPPVRPWLRSVSRRRHQGGRKVIGAGPGSDLSEEPVRGCEPVTLDVGDVPWCPPAPVTEWSRRRRPCVGRRCQTAIVQAALASAHVLPAAFLRL